MIPADLQRTPRTIDHTDPRLAVARATNDVTYEGTTAFSWSPATSAVGTGGTFTPGAIEFSQTGTGASDATFHYSVSGLTSGSATLRLLTHPGGTGSGDYFPAGTFAVDANGSHTASVHWGDYGVALGGSFTVYSTGHLHESSVATVAYTPVPGLAVALTPGTWKLTAEIVYRGDSTEAEASLSTPVYTGSTGTPMGTLVDVRETSAELPFDGFVNQLRILESVLILDSDTLVTVAARGGISAEDAVIISQASNIIAVKVA